MSQIALSLSLMPLNTDGARRRRDTATALSSLELVNSEAAQQKPAGPKGISFAYRPVSQSCQRVKNAVKP